VDRHARQIRLAQIGEEGQRRLRAGHVLVVGCGALGSVAVELLARAGVGTITVVDRDVVERSNLQRQFLFDDDDARQGTPKAEAAKTRVGRIDPAIRVRAFHDDFSPRNAERYAEGVDVLVDGLDHLATRYLLNDLAVARGIPYVYGAAVGTEGMCAVIRPGSSPCLRCLFPEPPPPGSSPTCATAGVLGPVTALVASLEAANAIKLLVGAAEAVEPGLLILDLWSNLWRRVETTAAREPGCVCCGARRFEFLHGDRIGQVTALCGRDAVQLSPAADAPPLDLDLVRRRFAQLGHANGDDRSVRVILRDEPLELAVFADGRMVVRGTTDPEVARAVIARTLGG
jgi:adenylyltransferase/sulfurtransferase